MNFIDLLELDTETPAQLIEIIKIGSDETAIVPITSMCVAVVTHYSDELEIRGYTHCNGKGCILCRIGRKADNRVLVPVYLPATDTIGVLMVSTAKTPHALFPQLMRSLRSGRREVLFVRRDGAKYTVAANPIPENDQRGAAVIDDFKVRFEAGEIELEALINRVDNDDLKEVPSISRLLELRGAA